MVVEIENSGPEVTATETTGKELPKVATSDHVTPASATVAEEEVRDAHPFWALLATAGYQTW